MAVERENYLLQRGKDLEGEKVPLLLQQEVIEALFKSILVIWMIKVTLALLVAPVLMNHLFKWVHQHLRAAILLPLSQVRRKLGVMNLKNILCT